MILRTKCSILGAPASGKSSLAQFFHSDGSFFPKAYTMTTGVEFSVKPVSIPDCSDVVELHLLDCSGEEAFVDIVNQFIVDSALTLVVYDVSDQASLDTAVKWLQLAKAARKDLPFQGALVANKTDLESRRLISEAEGRKVAAQFAVEYFECSVKENVSVEAPFYYLANLFHKSYNKELQAIAALL